MATDVKFRVIDVRPTDGWRVALITPNGLSLEPMPGWLVQEEVEYDDHTLEDTGLTGFRQIVASVCVDGDLQPIDDVGGFWLVIGPGQLEPTPDEVAKETDRRRRALERSQS
ncbi:hypothetical protein [Streptomyces sp. NPDC020681]|uniref:hypothetical protein n=1 Tax=Streptomyces sp. NPDC020681 TaxID=3365083 RepID=UPI0037897F7B